MDEHAKNSGKIARWPRWTLSAFVLACVLFIFVLGLFGSFPGLDALAARLGTFAESPWGLPLLVSVFCVGAFIGIPQFILFGFAMIGFGPWWGMAYAWLATLCSGALTFWTGRFGGEGLFNRFAGARAHRLSGFLEGNAFKASALVRMIPTGPFILVNMAFGISKAPFVPFLTGLAVGAIPKLGLVALVAQGAVAAENQSAWGVGLASIGVVLIGVWLVVLKRQNAK